MWNVCLYHPANRRLPASSITTPSPLPLLVFRHLFPTFFSFCPRPSMDAAASATADHFIYVTQVYFCGNHCPLKVSKHLLIEQFLSSRQPCVSASPSLCWSSRPFADIPADAVVLWDWIISLPREYRFVSLCLHSENQASRISLRSGMEDALDPGQNGLPLLPASLYDFLNRIFFLIRQQILGHYCSAIPSLLLRH